MISPKESFLSLDKASEYIGSINGGTPPSVLTVRRWCRTGFRGVILESEKRGNPRVTSREAIARFFDRISTPLSVPQSSACAPSIESLEAEQQLIAMGW